MRQTRQSVAGTMDRSGLHRLVGLLQSWGAHLYRYAIAGGITVLADFSVFWLLITFTPVWYLHAHFISRTVGGVVCFLVNRHYTFGRRGSAGVTGEMIRFGLLYGASFLLSSGLVYAFVTGIGMGSVIGKFIAECTVFLFNYTVMKYWVMRRGVQRA